MFDSEKDLKILLNITEGLTKKRQNVKDYVTRMLREGRLEFSINMKSEETFTDINSGSESGDKNEYSISLGIKPISEKVVERITFLAGTFSKESLLQYKLLHEVAHTFIEEMRHLNTTSRKKIETLFAICKTHNQRDNLFFTGLASYKAVPAKEDEGYVLPDSHEIVPVHEEDATELLTMAFWSKQYLLDFIHFLVDDRNKKIREQIGIRGLSPEEGAALFKLIIEITETKI